MEKTNKEKLDDIILGCKILTDRMTKNSLEIVKLRKQIRDLNMRLKNDL